jgi:hypothetical protein
MKRWKKLLLCSISLVICYLIGIAVIIACTDEADPYDYYTTFFHPDVQGEKDFGAFYFTNYSFTYDDKEPISEAAINAAEWATYLGQPVKSADVEKIMYHLDSAGKEQAYHFFEPDQPVADSLASSKFLWALKAPQQEAARKYYQFAHEAEVLGQSSDNYWDPAPRDTAGLKAAAGDALQSAMEENDSFLKLRYFYQAQKLNHYAANYAAAKDIYDKYISNISSKSHVKGWALALKAGEERRLGDTTQAAYLFSKVFANYPERRLQAYRNYHYIDAPISDVLKLARTPQEKASLYALTGLANPKVETENLEQVYKNAPTSPLVGTLLVREINKLEEYYLTPALYNNSDEFYSGSSRTTTDTELNKPAKKWLLWAGLAVLLAGIVAIIVAFRQKEGKPAGKIAAGLLTVAGIVCITWFSFGRPKTSTGSVRLSQGSFFVAVPDSVKTKYDAHIEKLRSFCEKLTSDARYTEPEIGVLTNAYLYFMQNRPDDGLSILKKTDGQKLGSKMTDQKGIINLLLSAQRIKQLKAVDEAALLPSLQWLKKKVIAGAKPEPQSYPITPDMQNQFAITSRNFYTYVLAPAYLRQGDTARAALAMLASQNDEGTQYRDHMFKQVPDFWYNYLHSTQLKQVIEWKARRPADKYLAFLSNSLKEVDDRNLYELLGTIYLREHRYQDAVTAFKVERAKSNYAPIDEANIAYGDPFVERVNDYAQPPTRGITKLQFALKMAEVEAKIKNDPKNATLYYKMATGLYNTSTYSDSWNLISYIWSSYDFGRKQMYYYDGDYIKTSLAEQYYLKARELSSDQEFKAKCTFMAAKCEQKQHDAPSFMDNYETYDQREKAYLKLIRQNDYFKEMQQYKNTKFYQKAVNECAYLSDFINNDQ